jgi:hypothetical protein
LRLKIVTRWVLKAYSRRTVYDDAICKILAVLGGEARETKIGSWTRESKIAGHQRGKPHVTAERGADRRARGIERTGECRMRLGRRESRPHHRQHQTCESRNQTRALTGGKTAHRLLELVPS